MTLHRKLSQNERINIRNVFDFELNVLNQYECIEINIAKLMTINDI